MGFRKGGAPLDPRKRLARLMVQKIVHRAKNSCVCNIQQLCVFIQAQTRFLKRKENYMVGGEELLYTSYEKAALKW